MKPYTLIVTSCDRHDLLKRAIDSYIACADMKPTETIIVEDSQAPVPEWFSQNWTVYFSALGKVTWIRNQHSLGEFKSNDVAMENIKTDWVFFLEDDWLFTEKGFLRKSFDIMEAEPRVWTVSLRAGECNGHPVVTDPRFPFPIHEIGWGGFGSAHWNPGLRRVSDYKRIGSYGKHIGDVLVRDQEIALSKLHQNLGYIIASPYKQAVIKHTGAQRHVVMPKFAPRVLIAIPTCYQFQYDHDSISVKKWTLGHKDGANTRRDAMRNSWLGDLKGIDYKFFFGSPSPLSLVPREDEVLLPCPDDYAHLPSKTVEICKWALAHGYDWILKLDDDTWARADALLPELWLHRGDYMGHAQGLMCSGGAAYWLSSKAMRIIAEVKNPEAIHWAEDRMVGQVLASRDIYPIHLESHRLCPRITEDAVTIHEGML